MTHEQKPESAEFRTREEQLSALMGVIAPHQEYPMVAELLMRHIIEAEARGAAEQRRKEEHEFEKIVAERDDAEDFIRKMAEVVLGEVVEWSNGYNFQNALNEVSERIYLLEKNAANVAALIAEAVAAERERCAKFLDERAVFANEWCAHWGERYAKTWAAAIREGGEG